MFFPKYAPNGLHGVGGKLADRIPYGINVSLRPRAHRPTRISVSQTFRIKIFRSPTLSKLLNPVKNSAF